MKTSVIDVRDLLSPLSASDVEKQLAKMPGVQRVEVNIVSGIATVLYDEAVTSLNAIEGKVRECGHYCGGELVPKHLCEPAPSSSDTQITVDSAVATLPRQYSPRMVSTLHTSYRLRPPKLHILTNRRIATAWATKWAMAQAGTCRRWRAICATGSSLRWRLQYRCFYTHQWAWRLLNSSRYKRKATRSAWWATASTMRPR